MYENTLETYGSHQIGKVHCRSAYSQMSEEKNKTVHRMFLYFMMYEYIEQIAARHVLQNVRVKKSVCSNCVSLLHQMHTSCLL
jgi:hypothetical protein